ncbi:hypothetical protein Nepgr_009094 [Nepenthes gracilis]|uniref:PGG domain-containing protein n=1 Tax=Nepenthes gracilis TaxID=150966 RepID=A0AAD3SAS6_NEPGR|nr:hypothetical protein Nepgr_009094 [Nepenthes gracilis]
MNSRSNVSLETTGAESNMTSTVAGGSTLRLILKEILQEFLSKQEAWHKQHERNGRLESQRNTIMIVASLFAAAAFQAGANPPSGFSQFNSNSNDISPTAAPSILAAAVPFIRPLIVTANATAFFTSAYVFLLLLSGLPMKNKICTGILRVVMWIPIVAAGFSFVFSTALTDLFSYLIILPVMLGYIAIFGIIILGHIGRFLVKMVRRCWRKHRSSSSSTAAPANRDSV